MAKRVNLYLCAKTPGHENFYETDGVNMYRHEFRCDEMMTYFYRYERGRYTPMFSITVRYLEDAAKMRFNYYFIDGKLYITASVRADRIRMLLIHNGEIVDDIFVKENCFMHAYGYRTEIGYLSNIIGRSTTGKTITEYFIDSIANRICHRSYKFKSYVQSHNLIASTKTCISIVRNVIETIYRDKPDICHQSTAIEGPGKLLSRDGKYIYAFNGRIISIYNSVTFKKIIDAQQSDKLFGLLSGDVNGIFVFEFSWRNYISQLIDRHGRFLEIIDVNSYRDLHITSLGKLGSKTGELYQFDWDWQYYHMQRPEIKRAALYIFMMLTLRCGVVKHIAMIIGEIAMSP